MFYLYSTCILLFLRNILQKSSKNYETIARFSLLCIQLLKVQSAKPLQLAQNNCNLLWQILVALTKLLVGQKAWSEMVIFGLRIFAFQLEFLQWALNIRNIKTFGWMMFETYLGWWNELIYIRSDCFKIFAVSLIWRRPKCLIRLICVTACFTWSGSKLVLFPLALIQRWWFKMHKFQSRIVFIWLTKLHLSSEITATCSEMVICSIFGSKMYTSFERS